MLSYLQQTLNPEAISEYLQQSFRDNIGTLDELRARLAEYAPNTDAFREFMQELMANKTDLPTAFRQLVDQITYVPTDVN